MLAQACYVDEKGNEHSNLYIGIQLLGLLHIFLYTKYYTLYNVKKDVIWQNYFDNEIVLFFWEQNQQYNG